MSFFRKLKDSLKRDTNQPRSDSRTGSVQSKDEDDEALGLKLLAEGVDPQIDVIAVHGLSGHRENTWTANNGKMWLKDFLPHDLPNARIFTYGYNGDPSTQSLCQHAEEIVDHLSLHLQATSRRPIIFIVHSLGGNLVKSALIISQNTDVGRLERRKSIRLSTYGIVFMGTPPQATGATLGNLFFKVASLGIKTNQGFIQDLKRDCDLLEDQMQSYLPIGDDFDTICCYETRSTPPLSETVVPYACAVVPGAPSIAIQQNHTQMVKFSSNNAKGYKDISLHVKEMVGKASTV